jgi:hypothetical protein
MHVALSGHEKGRGGQAAQSDHAHEKNRSKQINRRAGRLALEAKKEIHAGKRKAVIAGPEPYRRPD